MLKFLDFAKKVSRIDPKKNNFKISKNNAFNSIKFGGFRQICDQKNPQNEESKALSAITKMQIS